MGGYAEAMAQKGHVGEGNVGWTGILNFFLFFFVYSMSLNVVWREVKVVDGLARVGCGK